MWSTLSQTLLSSVDLLHDKPRGIMNMKLILLAGCVAVWALAGDVPKEGRSAPPPFRMFEAMLYRDRPTSQQMGFERVRVIYAVELWQPGQSRDEPIEAQVRAVARKIPKGSFVSVDIEHWDVAGERASENIRKLIQVITWLRQENPTLVLGYYGLLPIREYWKAIRGPGHASYRQWIENNKRLEELAEHVDALFPSLYTFYPDQDGWERYAIANLKQARRFNKPVYPFVWPQYHPSNKKLKHQYVSGAYWARQLRVCRRHADGLVIWGGWKQAWNDQAPWWQETVRFLKQQGGGQQ